MAGYIDFKPKKQIATGTVTSTSSSQLIAAGSAFISQGVEVGDVVFNISSPEFFPITNVVSETVLDVDGSSFTSSNAFSILKLSETESFPVQIDSITRVQVSNIQGETMVSLTLRIDTAVNARALIVLKNSLATVSERNAIIDQFMADINETLISSYNPSARVVSSLPLSNEYMFGHVTTV